MNETPLRVIPLGGLGEIGQNMMVLEYGDEIVVIDAGILFLEEDIPGVDFAIPDISYLVQNKEKVRAILLTHGHEDHIGALPYVLDQLDVPVYASRLTHGLITVKLRDFGTLSDARLNVVEPHAPFKIGAFRVEFFRVCHSIPDAMGIAVTTPLGLVIHTGDFKIDHTPVDGKATDFPALAKITAGGVLLLFSDSTYAEVEGYTESEQIVGETIHRVIAEADGRVMVATFASLISRIQQVLDAAVDNDRKVAVIGRSMINNVKMAVNLGYLDVPAGTIISVNEARQLPNDQVVIVATGSQGEPTSALVRIANREHRDVRLERGDTVVISASPIPGNETVVANTIDNLYRLGAKVLYSRTAMVHVHGHASREELKMMLSLVRPSYFVPVHGEYRHLMAHADIARSMRVADDRVFVLEDGDVLEITPAEGRVVDSVPAVPAFVDRRRTWESDSDVFADRRRLARDGTVALAITISRDSGGVIKAPVITSSGFIQTDDQHDLFTRASNVALTTLDRERVRTLDLVNTRVKIAEAVSDFLYEETGMRPVVLAFVEEV
jgi:ribonuclease J